MKVRRLLSILLALILCLSLAACGANSAPEGAYDRYEAELPMAEENAALSDSSTTGNSVNNPSQGRKWIVTVHMDAETEDLDALLAQLDGHIADLNGYIENHSIYNGSNYSRYRYRNATLTIRIPADKVDAFAAQVGDISNVVSTDLTREDITLAYVDTESRMKALQTEEARLLELMEQAETMSDLLEIEARLTDVRYELESVTSRLRTYDNQINYATIHLDISEVQEYTPVEDPTLWERISGSFTGSLKDLWESLQDLLVLLVVAFPFLLVYGGIALAIILLIRRIRKKDPSRKKLFRKTPEKKQDNETT